MTPPNKRSLVAPWGLLDVAAAYFGGMFVAGVLAAMLGQRPAFAEKFLTNIPLWLALGLVPLWATHRRGNGPIADLGLQIRFTDVAAIIPGVLLQLVLPVLYAPFVDKARLEEPARALVKGVSGVGTKVLLVVMVVVIAPVVEELFYRGLMLRTLMRALPSWAAVAATALVFAAVHFQPLQLVGLALVGCLTGALAVRSGRLGPAVFAHVGFNLAGLVGLGVL